jgi:hypothetical protein
MMRLTARNTDLDTLAALLKAQSVHKLDVVQPAESLRAEGGKLFLSGVAPVKVADERLDEDGVTPAEWFDPNGAYDPTDIAVEHLAEKLGIPVRYLRKMAADRPDLFDANVNGWLRGTAGEVINGQEIPGDDRSFLFRGFRPTDGDQGVMRGLLSDRYNIIDNLDILTAALKGIRKAGLDAQITGCDLTERRMRVRVVVPAATVWAHTLFQDYRTPFRDDGPVVKVGDGNSWTIDSARAAAAREGSAYTPGTEPIIFAGFEIGNGELGGGAASITPYALANICGNGLRITAEAERKTHLGGRLEEGVIQWSAETRERELAAVVSKCADAAQTFASTTYWAAKVAELEAKAGKSVVKPTDTIRVIGKRLAWTEADTDDILSHFTLGGQLTAGGVMNAVTSYAQTVADPDKAADLEASAVRVLDLV